MGFFLRGACATFLFFCFQITVFANANLGSNLNQCKSALSEASNTTQKTVDVLLEFFDIDSFSQSVVELLQHGITVSHAIFLENQGGFAIATADPQKLTKTLDLLPGLRRANLIKQKRGEESGSKLTGEILNRVSPELLRKILALGEGTLEFELLFTDEAQYKLVLSRLQAQGFNVRRHVFHEEQTLLGEIHPPEGSIGVLASQKEILTILSWIEVEFSDVSPLQKFQGKLSEINLKDVAVKLAEEFANYPGFHRVEVGEGVLRVFMSKDNPHFTLKTYGMIPVIVVAE